jgi:hypothetical protein
MQMHKRANGIRNGIQTIFVILIRWRNERIKLFGQLDATKVIENGCKNNLFSGIQNRI